MACRKKSLGVGKFGSSVGNNVQLMLIWQAKGYNFLQLQSAHPMFKTPFHTQIHSCFCSLGWPGNQRDEGEPGSGSTEPSAQRYVDLSVVTTASTHIPDLDGTLAAATDITPQNISSY